MLKQTNMEVYIFHFVYMLYMWIESLLCISTYIVFSI